MGNGGAAVVRKEGNGRRRGRERRQGQRWAGVSQMGGGHRRHEDRFGMGRIRDVRESVLREGGSRKPDPDNTHNPMQPKSPMDVPVPTDAQIATVQRILFVFLLLLSVHALLVFRVPAADAHAQEFLGHTRGLGSVSSIRQADQRSCHRPLRD